MAEHKPGSPLKELESALEAGKRDLEAALEKNRQELDKALEKSRRDMELLAHKGREQVDAVVAAGGYSWQGLRYAIAHERAFKLEAALLVVFVPLALWLGDNFLERGLLLLVTLLVPIVELLNSAVEATVDRIGPERHELSGRAKDLGSAAVMLSLILAGVVWADKLLGLLLR